ncbi:heterodimeric methylmalonyl-CoA mutase small subunit [Tenacibaculum sp. MAR_2009_124]|uniref:methylmalonyl-CoA mutase subunit beta n=1 Tax=Tenacibaculum sp. MAR_2009_124 TaxID=1250059 RepID=UPI000899B320|nr:methylmalonyl-CoA mutase subunit beta [Tenacibaculum sp. MAR_2009_124]SEB70586.1 heterodimeric methylmalonyl-CoA mutase small subunit [Tenacibaculum sp. MAR_2009_124]
MKKYLFNEFETVSPQAWKTKIQVDLKGADYNDSLLWKTNEGITVKPFYTKEDRTFEQISLPEKGFEICQTIEVKNEIEANTFALKSLQRGANSLEFTLENPIDYKTLLKDINFKEIKTFFNFKFLSSKFILELSEFTNSSNCYFNIDIIGNLGTTGNWYNNLKTDHLELENVSKNVKNFLGVNASIYQNAGANITQQLAYALAHANEYLNHFGKEIAKHIHFNFSIGNNYFFEIAKLRAFRILWASLLKEYEIEENNTQIFSQPSLRNKTLYDYNVNMLRTTSECMSAILGGSNVISNQTYNKTFQPSDEFGERISRNQLLILQQESELKEAQNIADGSYFIEDTTKQLVNKALEIFKQIEKGGGFLKQLKEGTIQKKIKESANKEQEQFNNDELVLLGTNKIQNPKDRMKDKLNTPIFVKIRKEKTLIEPIIEKRLAEELEQKRLKDE